MMEQERDPFNSESESLSLIEELIVSETEKENTDIGSNNLMSVDAATDSFTGGNLDFSQSEISEESVTDTSFAPPISTLEFQGGFGDFDGGNDVTFEVKNDDSNVVETYALKGKGQATLYRDSEGEKAYIFFSGTDDNTSVEISAKSNISFGNYIGDSLKIETTGSIDGENVILKNPDETGLILKSGIEGKDENLEVLGYDAIHLGAGSARGINNEGDVIVNGYGASLSFIYSDGEINYLGSDNSIVPNGINDSRQVVGSFISSDNNRHAFLYSNGSINDLGVLPEAETYDIPSDFGLIEVPYDSAYSYAEAINNNGQIVGVASSKHSWGYDLTRLRPFISDGGSLTEFQNELNSLFGNEISQGDYDSYYDSYWFYSSEAYGINDLGQVVGSYFDDYTKAFVYGGQNINLHSLLGDNVQNSFARDINNEGQIIGEFSTRGSNYNSFVYNDGQVKTLGGSLFDINNNGTAVGLNRGTAILYDINNDTGINLNSNSIIDSEEAIWLTSALGINDKGQIAATGYFASDVERTGNAFLLNPRFVEPELDDYINIGNITTFGDTILLQGNEINLTGEAITTAGGEITFDGATRVNSNLIIDSSVTEDEVITGGGNITSKNTFDATGTNNLRLQAGTGNVLFSDTVGEESRFFDISVEGASSVTINKDITVNGNLTLEVIDDIKTEDLSVDGITTISLGKVGENIYDSTGNVTTGNINTLGLEVLNNGNFEARDIATIDGDIDVISLNQLTVGQLTATNGAVSLISGTAGINVNGTVQGDNGFIALAQQDIITNEITSSQDAVILKSSQGAVSVNGSVNANDDVSLAAANNVTVGAVTSTDSNVALISATGMIALGGTISTMEDVTVASAQSLTIDQEIKAELGSIALGSTEGSVTVSVPIDTAIGVNIAARQNVSTKRIRTYGGDIVVSAEQGTATIGGKVNSRGGDVLISALGKVRTKNIISRSGDVSVISDTNSVLTGYIRTDRGNKNGNVYLEAARNIKVRSSVDIDGTQYSIYAGEDGVINIAHQRNKSDSKRAQFVIGDITVSGTVAPITPTPVTPTPVTPTPTVKPSPLLIYIEIFRRVIDAGGTAPAHQSEINPLTGQPYADEAEFELAKKFTPNQQDEIIKFVNISTYRLDFDYVEEKGRFDTQNETGCFAIPLEFHLGLDEYHNQYADYVTGSRGDVIVIPPTRVGVFSSTTYDGIVRAGSKATLLSPPQISQKIGDLAEVKTGYRGLNRIVQNNAFSDDLELYNSLVNQVIKEATIARACQKEYFISFDLKSVANSARQLLNSEPRILALGLTIKVNHILSLPLLQKT